MKKTRHNEIVPEVGLQEILKEVSRSFYLSMVWLPSRMRRGVAAGYLLARAADSVADSSSANVSIRVRTLEKMGEAVEGKLSEEEESQLLGALSGAMADAQSKVSERRLLQRYGDCLALMRSLPEGEKDLVCRVLTNITKGQLWDLTFFAQGSSVTSDEQTFSYTYWVAGCVGEFWTRLGAVVLGDRFCKPSHVDLLTEAGVRYGRGLQLINILRDMEEDEALGRSYICSESSLERWQSRAERYLMDGLDYARRLRMFRLRFTAALPALIGMRTLRLIRRRRGKERVKTSRSAVYWCVVQAAWFSLFPRGA